MSLPGAARSSDSGRTSLCVRPPPSLIPTNVSTAVNNRNHKIRFRHPAFPEAFDQNVLLTLYGFDSPDGGLHVGTARLCCGIVARNAYDGYFTETKTGPELELGNDDILTGKSYYFHVPQNPKYPVYYSFWNWAYPHSPSAALRTLWPIAGSSIESQDIPPVAPPSASNMTATVLRRDQSCRISGHRDYVECAHLCPRNESDWFRMNAMDQYNDNQQLAGELIADDISNAICLRSDIYKAFDDQKLVIVWKNSQWVVHFMQLTHELGSIYHNTSVSLDPGISPAFLLARLAWAVFPLLGKFFDIGIPREVCLRIKEGDCYKEVVKSLQGEELVRMGSTRGWSSSPKKRKAQPITDTDGTQMKRRRLSDSPSPGNSLPSLSGGSDSESKCEPGTATSEKERMAAFKRRECQKRRPSDPSLFCCNYNDAERAIEMGLPGKREYGGGYLCLECLGAEYDPRDDVG